MGASSWIKQRERYWMAPTQKAISRAIAAVEKELGKPLPRSWKAFLHGCGPGSVMDWFWLSSPTKEKKIPVRQRVLFRSVPEEPLPHPYQPWHRPCVAFGTTAGSGYLLWDTSKITDPVRNEYQIVETTRELERDREFDSFEAFWTAALTPADPGENLDAPFEPS